MNRLLPPHAQRHPRPARRTPRLRSAARLAALLLALSGGWGAARGDITLPAFFSDNMVLQQRTKINVWGNADPGESVTVRLGPDIAQTLAGADGRWALKLDGLKAGGPYEMMITGKNALTIENVAVGEVWLCAGESNMEYKTVAARNAQAELADADLPMVRLFVVKHAAAEKPEEECEGSWVVCDPVSAREYPAIGFFYARELNRAMHAPVGLIESAWGPSGIAAWTPRERLEKDPALKPALDAYDKAAAAYPAAQAEYGARLKEWQVVADAAKAAGSPMPRKPVVPLAPRGAREPGALYNGMIAPLERFAIRGVLWYQGETDTGHADLYARMFPAMIEAWRKGWAEGEFPFLYAQLSGFLGRRAEPGESRWAELREAQAAGLREPHTGMAVTVDTAEENTMHPSNKQDVAHRLALLAEAEAYGKGVGAASGPVFSGMTVEDGKAVLDFAHAEGGLLASGTAGLKGFQVAGADRKFAWAEAEIHGNRVTVSSKDVPQPVAVRYAWADLPDCGLMNGTKLPAAPFRTDQWVAGESASAPTPPASAPTPKPHRKHHPTAE